MTVPSTERSCRARIDRYRLSCDRATGHSERQREAKAFSSWRLVILDLPSIPKRRASV